MGIVDRNHANRLMPALHFTLYVPCYRTTFSMFMPLIGGPYWLVSSNPPGEIREGYLRWHVGGDGESHNITAESAAWSGSLLCPTRKLEPEIDMVMNISWSFFIRLLPSEEIIS